MTNTEKQARKRDRYIEAQMAEGASREEAERRPTPTAS